MLSVIKNNRKKEAEFIYGEGDNHNRIYERIMEINEKNGR